MKCTLPSPNRNCAPPAWKLEAASASVTNGSLGRCGPQCPSTRAAASSELPGARIDGTAPLATAPVQLASDMVDARSPMKKVLLNPSVKCCGRNDLFLKNAPSLVASPPLTPPFPLKPI